VTGGGVGVRLALLATFALVLAGCRGPTEPAPAAAGPPTGSPTLSEQAAPASEQGASSPALASPEKASPRAERAGSLGARRLAAGPGVPAGAASFQGEALAPGSRVADPSASGGAYARVRELAAAPRRAAGTYRLSARVRGPTGERIDLLVGGAMAGSYGLRGAWRVVGAVLWLAGASETVGVRSLGGAAVDVDWLALEPAAPTFTVRGNQVLWPGGAPFRARGLQIGSFAVPALQGGRYQLEWPQGEFVYPWGANAIRLSLTQELWLADCPSQMDYRERLGYRAAVARHVADATSRGIAVIVGLSHVERGEATGCAEPGRPYLKEMSDTRSPAFWQSVASAFRGNPLVIFDLYNEPHDIPVDVWRDGGTVTYRSGFGTTSYRVSGMQALYDAVRSTGATNLVVASGTRWATDPRALIDRPLDGYGIAAGLHVYCNTCDGSSPRLPPELNRQASPAVLSRFPVIVTETGWRQSDDPRFLRMAIDWASARGLGYSVFAYLRPGEWSILESWDPVLHVGGGTYTKPPSRRGAPAWNDLAEQRRARGYEGGTMPE
jgi:hypothetical protein